MTPGGSLAAVLARSTPMTVPSGLSRSEAKRLAYAQETYFREAWRDITTMWPGDPVDRLNRHTFIVFKPDALVFRTVAKSLSHMEQHGFRALGYARFRFDPLSMRELWRYELNIATLQRLDAIDLLLPAASSVLVTLRDERAQPDATASDRLKALKGPSQIALRRPDHLRSVIASGTNMLNNIHTPDETADVVRELGLLFHGETRRRVVDTFSRSSLETSFAALEHEACAEVPEHDLQLAGCIERIRAACAELGDSEPTARILRACNEAARTGHTDWAPAFAAMTAVGLPVAEWDKIVFAVACTECNEPSVELALPVLDKALAGDG